MVEIRTDRIERLYKEKGDTWPKVLRYNYEKYGDRRRAMRHKHYGIWQPYTWKDYYLNVKYLALGLLSLGLEAGDRVLIVGDSDPHWYWAELAAQAVHGISVGVCSDSLPGEIQYISENSEAKFAIVQDQEQIDKFLQIKGELPLLKNIIYWNYKGLAHYDDPILKGYREVLRMGERYEEEHPGLFEQSVEAGRADDICALVYTSGATGNAPKGAVHTHRTIRTSAEYLLNLDPWYENDNVVPYLPPAWMTEQWFGIGCHLLSASTLNFAEEPESQQRDTREIKPNIVCYSARVWEGQAARVQARVHDTDVVKRLAFRLFMPIGYQMADLKYRKQKPGLVLRMLYALAGLFLFRPLRASLGLSNVRICYTTGTMLSADVFRFYHALNLPLKSLYGTTEGGVLTGAKNDDLSLESVGPAHQGTEVRITDGGELTYRQPGIFLGYYKDPGKTAEVLKEGWFHSGDCGFVREDGHIVFVDRLNDLILLDNGEKLPPQWIESRLRFSPYIKDAWVVGGKQRPYASVVIIINYDAVSRWAGERRVTYSTFAELSQKPEVHELVKQSIDQINSDLPPGWRVKKYVNLHKELDPDEGELTRNRKLRRRFLEERYHELIDAIYADQTEVPIETRVRHRDGRVATTKTILKIKSVGGTA